MSLQNETAELSVIGCLLLDENSKFYCAELRGEHFYDQKCRKYYNALMLMLENGQPLDSVQIASKFKNEPWAIKLYETATDTVATTKAMEFHVSAVLEAFRNRKLLGATTIVSERLNQGDNADDLVSAYQKEMTAFVGQSDSLKGGEEILAEFWKSMESGKQDHHIKTGIGSLDNCTGGVLRGLATVIGARPSVGKSAFAANIMLNMAKSGRKVIMCSLEDLRKHVIGRMMSRVAGVDSMAIAQSSCNMEQLKRILDSMPKIPAGRIWINDRPGQSVPTIRADATITKMKHGLDVLIIDHLGVLTKDSDEYNSVSENIRGICEIAKELDIAVIVLHQLNRGLERRDDKRPTMSDLRGSGKVEEYARAIWFLHREGMYESGAVTNLEVIVAKATHGRTGIVKLSANMSRMAISDDYDNGAGVHRYDYGND